VWYFGTKSSTMYHDKSSIMTLFFCVCHIPKVAGSIPTVVRQTFQPSRCGYILRVTSETLYSPEYITPKHTPKNHILYIHPGVCGPDQNQVSPHDVKSP
jgi:hypothetical protein